MAATSATATGLSGSASAVDAPAEMTAALTIPIRPPIYPILPAPPVSQPMMGRVVKKPVAPPEPPKSEMEKVEEGQGVVLRTLIGLLAVFALAWVAGHPRVRQAEMSLGFEHVIGAGLPFVLLGLVLRSEWVGVLDDNVLHHLAPLFEFGLGWLGFLVGFRFNIGYLDRLPTGMPTVIAAQIAAPFAMVFAFCGALMLAFAADAADTTVIRDAIVLGAASAMTAARAAKTHCYASFHSEHDDIVTVTEQLDEIAAVVALLFLTAYFRPEGDVYTWRLPGTAWIFIALGMGVAIGLVVHIMLRQRATSSEFLAITLGSVAFAAGMADYLWLSPIVVCFIAGAIVSNLPLARPKQQLWDILSRVEWPLYLVFLTCVGAFWDVTDWRGWLLVPAFVLARLVGKWLSVRVLQRADIGHEYDALNSGRSIFARVSGLSIALVVGWESLYGGPSGGWIVTAVVGGAIVLEFLAQGWDRTAGTWLQSQLGLGEPDDAENAEPPAIEATASSEAPEAAT